MINKFFVATDITVYRFSEGKFKILLVKGDTNQISGNWVLPSGILEPQETLENCANRALFALTGIKKIRCKPLKSRSFLRKCAQGDVIATGFYALIRPKKRPPRKSIDFEGTEWFDLANLPKNVSVDQKEFIRDSHQYLVDNLEDTSVLAQLLPLEFTIPEFRHLYEAILQKQFDKRNFRKKILKKDILKSTGEVKLGVKGGPMLFTLKK